MADAEEWITGVLYIGLSIATIIILPRHVLHVFSLMGKYHDHKDRLAAIIKVSAVLMLGLAIITAAILRAFWFDQTRDCLTMLLFHIVFWKTGLALQYLTYGALVYQVGYTNVKRLKISTAIVVTVYAILTISLIAIIVRDYKIDLDRDGTFPFVCSYSLIDGNSRVPGAVIAILLVLWDIILSIYSARVFEFCQKKAEQDYKPDDAKSKYKIITIKKYRIIVSTTTVTLIAYLILAVLGIVGKAILCGIYLFITIIGLILMTRGYEEDAWFRILCSLCIGNDKNQTEIQLATSSSANDNKVDSTKADSANTDLTNENEE